MSSFETVIADQSSWDGIAVSGADRAIPNTPRS